MKVRHPAWAGQFYPASVPLLKQEIATFLDLAPSVEKRGRIVGLMAPHAGYVYSGRTAAAAFKQIAGATYETVIVMAPSHGAFIKGVSAYDGDCYESPLGRIPVNIDAMRRLARSAKNVHLSDAGHEPMNDRAEHALEVQLPLLQSVITDFDLVPLVFHDYSWENCRQLGEALADLFEPEKTLIVASTDLYHGHSYEQCRESDDATLKAVETASAVDFCHGADRGHYQACGAGPVTVLKLIGEKWNLRQPRVIARTNSADVTGTSDGYVVGYGAAILEMKKEDE